MNPTIRKIKAEDKPLIIDMMRTFYSSEAVLTNGSDEIFSNDVDACISDNPYLNGYVAEESGEILGYTMVAKSFSTEFGNLYVKEYYRGRGIGGIMLDYIEQSYKNCIFRLEAEEENERAIRLYRSHGFSQIPYYEMKK